MENDAVEGRAKRQKLDKTGRFAALQKLKEHKQRGSKHKYEVDNIENVYEVVDEREYTKEVLNRQEENWIVDDDGSGYVEDGRDIFDDDLDSASIAAASKSKGSNSKKRKAVSENAGRGNLQYMLSNMPSKQKETVNLGDDDILSELIQEIDVNQSNLDQTSNKTSLLNEKQAAKNYMNSFSVPKPPKVTLTPMKIKKIEKPISMKMFKSESILAKVQNDQNKSDDKDELNFTKKIDEALDSFDDDFDTNDFELLDQLEDTKTQRNENLPNKSNHIEEPSQKIDTSQNNIESSQLNDECMTQIEEYKSGKEQNETITEEQLLEGWNTMREGCNQDEIVPIVNVESGNIPLQENDDGKKVFRFFWWDAFEDRRIQPGVVFLFGKTYCDVSKSYVSCCVAVRNILRKIFLLPRPTFKNDCKKEVTLLDVYHEFNNNLKLDTFKSKKTTKNYPFDPDVPLQSEYLEVRYSAKSPQIPEEFLSGNTYSKIFGLNTSYLEILLLDQKIKGPCWLEVTDPEAVSNKISWCKYEVNCNTSNNLSVKSFMKNAPSPPPLTVATINTRTIVSHNTKNGSAKNEVVMITCLVQNKYFVDKQAPNPPFQQHFCVITRPDGKALPLNFHDSLQKYKGTRVQKMDSEKALITYFINQLNNIDPDLIVGHDLQGYQLDLFCNRLTQLGIRHFSKLGRLKRGAIPSHGKFGKELFCGRLVCDVKVSAQELIKSRSYDLDALCQTVLKVQDGTRLSLEAEDIGRMYQNSQDLLKLITLTMQDTAFILKIMYELNVIPLALQITNIAGNVMSRTLLGGRSERNEFLLLHAFTEKDYLVPDKEFIKKANNKGEGDTEISASKRKKPTYSGGLVLDPKVGFYDTLILLMDFNSLYPSIIQEYNVCFTTLIQNDDVVSFSTANTGVLPTEIRKLVESRREVKKLMKNPDLNKDVYLQYNIRQTALKLTANSMYGCLGFSNSRFFAKHLAAFITQRGREILTNTKDTVEKMAFEVIYGDTDSIMINTNCLDYDQVFKVGNKIKVEINKLYKQVELDIDGVFKYLLLLKKKKYAAVTLSKMKNGQLKVAQEHKGLDIVRRDWSQLSAEAGKIILNHILSDQTIEEKITNIQQHLTKLKSDLEQNIVPLPLLVITKQLTKNPKEYSEKNALTHVQVALRYNSKGGKQLQNGDTVPYIICEDGTSNAATQRGYHIEEYKNSTTLKLDVKYYLAQQIHPVISRLCSPIPELDSYQIANWLGLDTTHFKKPNHESSSVNKNDLVQYNDEIRYRNCEPFIFTCYFCKKLNTITDLIVDNQPFLNKCMNQECSVRPLDYLGNVQNQLILAINKYIRKFYQFEMTCEDPSCTYDTNHVSTRIFNKYTVCKMCNEAVMYVKYPAKDLHMQLMYFQKLVDVGKHPKKHLVNSSLEIGYNTLKETVDKILIHSNFNVINLQEMFAPFAHKKECNEKSIKIEDEDFYDPEENDDE